MLELASVPFYTHDKAGGYILVAVFCGAMIVWTLYVAYINFGPPAKRRSEEAGRK